MLSFFREHDQEKRMAFSKLRDFFVIRAKANREDNMNRKREKVMNYMNRWDDYRERREIVIGALLKV